MLDKAGGIPLTHSNIQAFNSLIFDSDLLNLTSIGFDYISFNQRADSLIHLKLDRVFVNNQWIVSFPNSLYRVLNVMVIDHSPLVMHPGSQSKNYHYFQYKNYWSNIDSFWSATLNTFTLPGRGNPLWPLWQASQTEEYYQIQTVE